MCAKVAGTVPMRKHTTYRVFISCTSVDLLSHRVKLEDTIAHMDQFAVAMNHFGARGYGDAVTVSLDELVACDIYVLLVAWRYGSIVADQAYAVTHLEYHEARRLNRPILIFLADPSTENDLGPEALFPAQGRDWPQHKQQVLAFRNEVSDGAKHVVDYFTDAGDLAAKVATALYRYLRDLRPVPRDVPARIPDFVGRAAELAALREDLLAGQSVGLSAAIAGMAGVGKSALAAETLRTLAVREDAFPGGITWVRCDGREGLRGLAWVYDQLLAAWGVFLGSDQLSQLQTPDIEVELREQVLRAQLRPFDARVSPAPALVLLDNVEVRFPLDRALAHLSPLGITLLVTSRHDVETVGFRQRSLDVLPLADAIQLFHERFIERGGIWIETRDSLPASQIVESLGRLPLAIELAAARVARAKTGVAALARELERAVELDRLTDQVHGTQSVRYIFSQSLAQLSKPLQTRFAILGLPDGPDWPRDLIQNVLREMRPGNLSNMEASPDSDRNSDDLEILAAYSLVTLIGVEEPDANEAQPPHQGTGRVRVHPLLRIHARDEWKRLPAALRATVLSKLLAEVDVLVEGHRHDYATLAREEELIAGVLQRAVWDRVELKLACEIITKLTDYLNLGGHWRLGIDLFKLKLDAERELHDRLGEGTTLNNLGRLAELLGHLEEAARFYEEALAIRQEQEVHDRVGEGVTLNNLGSLSILRSRLQEASYYLNAALPIRREVHDRLGEGTTLNNLGRLAEALGHLEEAARFYEEALAIRQEQEVHDRVGEGVTLNNLGQLAEALGNREQARHFYERALAACAGLDRPGEGTTLNNLGRLAEALGNWEQARHFYERALEIFRSIGANAAKEVSSRLAELN